MYLTDSSFSSHLSSSGSNSSDWGKKIKRFQDSAPFELKRQEALNLLKKWRDSL